VGFLKALAQYEHVARDNANGVEDPLFCYSFIRYLVSLSSFAEPKSNFLIYFRHLKNVIGKFSLLDTFILSFQLAALKNERFF